MISPFQHFRVSDLVPRGPQAAGAFSTHYFRIPDQVPRAPQEDAGPSIQHFRVSDIAPRAPQEAAGPSIRPENSQKFTWNKETKAIFTSACFALIYVNGGNLELKKERVTNGKQKTALFSQAIEHILQRGNFPEFTPLPKRAVQYHLDCLRRNSKKRGSTLEEELLKQYQALAAKIIVNDIGERSSALLAELNKFGIKPEEYNQGVPIETCFKWDEEREKIFASACLALIYLNGGLVELSEERITDRRITSALSLPAIEHILQRGNFPEFKNLSKRAIQNNLKWLKSMTKKNGSIWEEEILDQYQELEQATLFNEAGEEIPAIWKEVEKFGIKPDDYDSWLVMEPTKQNPRKRAAEEPADLEAEPGKKRPNNAAENPPRGNRVMHWKKRLITAWKKNKQPNHF